MGLGHRLFPDRIPGLSAHAAVNAEALLFLELLDDLRRGCAEQSVSGDLPAAILELRLELLDPCPVGFVVTGVVLRVR